MYKVAEEEDSAIGGEGEYCDEGIVVGEFVGTGGCGGDEDGEGGGEEDQGGVGQD